MKRRLSFLICIFTVLSLLFSGCTYLDNITSLFDKDNFEIPSVSLDSIPAFDGEMPYVIIIDNNPFFVDESTETTYEAFGELDSLGRCTVAIACIGIDLMPTEDRGNISHIKPSGWQSVKYDTVDGQYLYNRCHLIGFQLTGENDNEKNLITGTRYMNVDGMLPFENMVADYVKETEYRVLYRVTPIYDGDNLVASGVLMEAKSVEDDEICFCVYVYNAQPGIVIDYGTGESRLSTDPLPEKNEGNSGASGEQEGSGEEKNYILNTSSKKFHNTDCSGAQSISEANRKEYTGARQSLIEDGYTPCGICKP